MSMDKTVGRFAPTPSGKMHLGNVLCCLLAWLSARSASGKVILRVEDLDTERSSWDFQRQIEEDLLWLGLYWDEGGVDADAHRYCQSRRTDIYLQYYDKLREMGLVYPCFCSRAELHAASAPHRSDGRFLYTGTCRNLTPAQIAEKRKTRAPSSRIRVPDKEIAFTDLHYGPYTENLSEECGDFVVRRADGVFAYQLAVAIDDALMRVTEVVRGNDLLSSSARQIWLHELFDFPPPRYGHIPLLTDYDGRRLSKRDRDLDLSRLRERYRAEEIIGMLGTAAGLLPEYRPVTVEELIPLFDWKKIPFADIRLPENFPEKLF